MQLIYIPFILEVSCIGFSKVFCLLITFLCSGVLVDTPAN